MSKLKKPYLFLFIILLIGLVVGILFSNILSSEDSKLVANKISVYFNNIKEDVPIDYFKNLINSLKNNFIYLTIIWILGLGVIGLIINNFILFFKSFILGFSIGSIINIYFYKGIVLSFFYIFPSLILNIIILLIMTYYANEFSLKIFNLIFRKKNISFHLLIRKYIKVLLYLSIISIISSLIETFIMPFSLKLFSFLIE